MDEGDEEGELSDSSGDEERVREAMARAKASAARAASAPLGFLPVPDADVDMDEPAEAEAAAAAAAYSYDAYGSAAPAEWAPHLQPGADPAALTTGTGISGLALEFEAHRSQFGYRQPRRSVRASPLFSDSDSRNHQIIEKHSISILFSTAIRHQNYFRSLVMLFWAAVLKFIVQFIEYSTIITS